MKKNGCLTWIIGFFVVCLLIGLYSLAWIPAIGFIIYYLIKKDYSGTRKRNFIISIIIFITSLLLFIWGTNSSSLTDIQADWGKTTFDVSETVEVKITPTPSDAKIEKLTLSDNDIAKLKYKDGKAIVSFKKIGTATVTFTANDSIDSNATTITVKDKKAEEAAKKAKEEQKRLAEEKAKKEAEEKAAQEAAAAKAKAEAEAAAQAQAQAEAQQQAQAAAQAQAQQQQAQAQQQAGEIVYWVPNGQVYHSTQDCPSLGRSSTIYSGTIAQSGKSRPCKNCY
nr:MAG TPA: 50S ribosomal protein L39E [Caudoviricetes sp.]